MSDDRAQSSPSERVRDLLEEIAAGLELDADVEVIERDDEIAATLHGGELALAIGRHGETIDAIQHLAYKVANQGEERTRRVVVDAAGYRARRRAVLERRADEAAEAAVRTRQPVALDAMNAGERKIVHEYLKSRADVQTYSEGTEPDRHLVVAPLRST